MSLAELEQQGPPPLAKGPKCTIGQIAHVLPASERAALYRMFDNPAWLSTVLAKTLAEKLAPVAQRLGVTIGVGSVRRHRKRECQCDQSERDEHAA